MWVLGSGEGGGAGSDVHVVIWLVRLFETVFQSVSVVSKRGRESEKE